MESERPKQVAIFRQRLKDAGSLFRLGLHPITFIDVIRPKMWSFSRTFLNGYLKAKRLMLKLWLALSRLLEMGARSLESQ